jgi:hypothetical protein
VYSEKVAARREGGRIQKFQMKTGGGVRRGETKGEKKKSRRKKISLSLLPHVE